VSERASEHLTPSEPGQGSSWSRASSGDERNSPASGRLTGEARSLTAGKRSGYQRSIKGEGSFPSEFGHHLAGLIDGEGHFGIMQRRKPRTGTLNYSCIFAMDMRDDDTAVLERLQEVTGLGLLYNSGPRNQGPQRLDAKPVMMWRVHTKADCLALVAILEEYRLWTKKARDFHIWAQAVRYQNGPRPQGWEPMVRWYAEIRAIRQYDRPLTVEESYVVDALTLFELEDE